MYKHFFLVILARSNFDHYAREFKYCWFNSRYFIASSSMTSESNGFFRRFWLLHKFYNLINIFSVNV